MGRKPKRDLILEEALVQRDLEEQRIIEILKLTGRYTNALNPLIETYLDAYEVYYIKYSEWRAAKFVATKKHKNKSGATNEMKHPIAQQVEVWFDKKTKLISDLGLNVKNQKLGFTGPLAAEQEAKDKEKEEEIQANNKLVAFKKKVQNNG